MKIKVADASGDNVDRAGNVIKDDTKWILQEDPCALGNPVTQALWLVIKPSYQSYERPWFRPATQLSELLEAQLKADIGCQTCILEYPKEMENRRDISSSTISALVNGCKEGTTMRRSVT